MKRYYWVRLFALMLMIILFALAVLVASQSAFSIYKESATQRSIVRSVEDINRASTAIIDALSKLAQSAGQEQYEQLLEIVKAEDDTDMSEEELESYFRSGYANRITAALGKNSSQINDTLGSFLKNRHLPGIGVVDDQETGIYKEYDASGNTVGLRLKNVVIECADPIAGKRRDVLSYNIQFPRAVFHAGNDELFRYCLIAQKGIYITGQTSSIIGDIYAGKHTDQERRDAEIVYGETGTYGGINILTTQLGVRADRIICQGDVNINGSFVVFSPLHESLDCYAQRVNEIRGFSRKTMYTLEGTLIPTYRMDEVPLDEYYGAIRLVDASLAKLDTIPIYYDSDNDGLYVGKYRKLISGTDVDITSDFTGIVITPGNVIVHNDVNFEGSILCGDRIYIMGNNNIVANEGILRSIIASDLNDENNIKASNYIEGMTRSGYSDPEHYVIPYR